MTPDQLRAPGLRGSVEDRFWKMVSKAGEQDCWLWKGAATSRGYGRMQTPTSSSSPAHRVSYVLRNGSISPGLVIDHICRERLCVNPAHLRAVTPKANTLENSESPTAANASKTHCVHGHSLSGDNLMIWKGTRRCRECQYRMSAAYRNRKREERHLLNQDADHD